MTKFKKGVSRWSPCRWDRWLRRHDDMADVEIAEYRFGRGPRVNLDGT